MHRLCGHLDDPDDPVPFTYTSDSFEGKIHLELDKDTRQITVRDTETGASRRFLSTGVYGAGERGGKRAYQVTEMGITNNEDGTFTISLTVEATADSSIKASGTVTVRRLNRK